MEQLNSLLKHANEKNQEKVDWTSAWSKKYPVLKTYQTEVDIPRYAGAIRALLTELQQTHGYSELDAMLVLKDILAHEYMDHRTR